MTAPVTDLDAPEVVAGKVARIQTQIDRWALVSILLGLAFTMVNVQTFAAAGAAAWTLPWLAAWLLDPMVSILLLVVVRVEQVTARWQVKMAWQVTATKWAAFLATFVMNTWASLEARVWSDIVLHSVPPVFVLIGAEVLPKLREGLTEAVLKAREYAESNVTAGPLAPPPATPPTTSGTGDPRDEGTPGQLHTTATGDNQIGPVGASSAATPTPTPASPWSSDPTVRAGSAELTDRSRARPEQPQSRPAPRVLPGAAVDVDGAPGVSQAPVPPGEVVTPTTDTSAGPGLGAGPDQAPHPLGSVSVGPEQRSRPEDAQTDSDPMPGEDREPRVLLLVERLRDDPDLAGPGAEAALAQAGFGEVAPRTARRLLGRAREALARSPGLSSDTDATADGTAADPSVPGEQTPAPWAPTGTPGARPLALVRPAAATRPGDH